MTRIIKHEIDLTKNLITYERPDRMYLGLENIITVENAIEFGELHILIKESNIIPVFIEYFWDDGDNVYINVRDIKTGEHETISAMLCRANRKFDWRIYSHEYLYALLGNGVIEVVEKWGELESAE